MTDSKPFTGRAHASGEYDANDDDPDVTYTISNINRVDGKKFVRFQVNLAILDTVGSSMCTQTAHGGSVSC